MRFAFQFNRRVGAGTDPVLGTDTAPTTSADLSGTNVFKTKIAATSMSQRIAIGYQYTGAGSAPALVVQGYIYDGTSETWFTIASLGITVQAGDIAFLPLVHLIDTPQVAGGDPYVSKLDTIEFALVVAVAGGEPDGAYKFFVSSDISAVDDEIVVGTVVATEAKQDDIITALGLVDVAGATAPGSVPTADPLDLGAVVQNADPGPYTDGRIRRLRLDDQGRLITTDPNASSHVDGVDADDAVVTGNPVLIGGQHRSDPAADTVDNLDVGNALINKQRMLVTEDRAYDSPTDAVRSVPVHSVPDGWVPEDMSSSLGADGTVTKYLVMLPHDRFCLQFIPLPAAAEVITLTVSISNEVTGDVTTQTYTAATVKLFAVASFIAEAIIQPVNPLHVLTVRIQVTVSGWSAGTSAWDLFAVKGNN